MDDRAFTTFTRRTDYPKLGWLIDQLEAAGIECRLEGESFHAPILQVREQDQDAAWAILTPIDDVPDDDPRFEGFESRLPAGRKRCDACERFFARWSCAMTRYGECDCPKCQGYCECAEEEPCEG